jgi:hypothetical protein
MEGNFLFVKGKLPKKERFLHKINGRASFDQNGLFKELMREKDSKILHALFLFIRQRSLQYLTSSHTFSHFFRQVKGF